MWILGFKIDRFKSFKVILFIVVLFSFFSMFIAHPGYSATAKAASASSIGAEPAHPETSHSTRTPDPNDQTEAQEWLEIELEITIEQPDWLSISSKFKVHEIYLDSYAQITADGIRKTYEVESEVLGPDPPILISLYQKINDIFDRVVNNTFQIAFLITYDPIREINSFYYLPDENKYDPPIVVSQYSRIKLNKTAYFSAEELARYNIQSLSDLIGGTLKMGAKVTLDLTLYAGAGHTIKYLFKVQKFDPTSDNYQDQLTIEHKLNEIISPNNDQVKFSLDNTDGIYSAVKNIEGLVLRGKEPNKQVKETVQVGLNLTMLDLDAITINNSKFTINSLTLSESLNKLPSNFSEINILSADGLRLFYDNDILELSDIERELELEFNRLEIQLRKAFNTSTQLALARRWELSTLEDLEPLYNLYDTGSMKRMGDERPIVIYLFSSKKIKSNIFENVTSSTIKGLLNAGAVAALDISISPGYPYNYNLTISKAFLLKDLNPVGELVPGGHTYSISHRQSKGLIMVSAKPTVYHSSKANIDVEIDLHKLEILSFTEYLASVKIEAEGVLHHIKLEPNSRFARALPKRITMDYYNSDALRLVYTNGLLNLDEVEQLMYAIIEENISKLLEEEVKMRVIFNEELLEFDGDIHDMDDSNPVNFTIRASGQMKISEDRFVRMGGFITKRLELPVPGVKYWNVTYKLKLPKHINILGRPRVENASAEYFGPIVDRSSKDRDELRITIYGDPEELDSESNTLQVNVQLDIDITLWFFLSKILIPLSLFVVLIIMIISLRLYRRYKIKRLEQLITDRDMVFAEKEYGLDMNGRSIKTPEKSAVVQERRVRELVDEPGYTEDYATRVREIIPRVALEGKSQRSKKRNRGKSRRRNSRYRKKRSRRIERY